MSESFEQERMIAASSQSEDWDAALRPKQLNEYIGQEKIRANLNVFIQAATSRQESRDHVLL